jgi:hypothetical protein
VTTDGPIYLLSGKLVDKAMLVKFHESSVRLWKKAFQATEIWKEEGFDYNPIMPVYSRSELIQKFGLNGKDVQELLAAERVAGGGHEYETAGLVYGGVIRRGADIDARHFPSYENEVQKMQTRIQDVLRRRLGMLHGDAHPGNFITNIENGRLRVYMIDWEKIVDLSH